MKAVYLRKKYPNEWASIEAAAWDDMKNQFKKIDIIQPHQDVFLKKMQTIAYNAAYEAISLMHKYIKACQRTIRI